RPDRHHSRDHAKPEQRQGRLRCFDADASGRPFARAAPSYMDDEADRSGSGGAARTAFLEARDPRDVPDSRALRGPGRRGAGGIADLVRQAPFLTDARRSGGAGRRAAVALAAPARPLAGAGEGGAGQGTGPRNGGAGQTSCGGGGGGTVSNEPTATAAAC